MSTPPLSASERSALEELEQAESIDGHEAAFDLLDKRRPKMSGKDIVFLVAVVGAWASVAALQITEILPYAERHGVLWFMLPIGIAGLFRRFWPDDPNSDERRIARQLSRWHLQRVQSATKAYR